MARAAREFPIHEGPASDALAFYPRALPGATAQSAERLAGGEIPWS
jgi:hypothetical protein